MNTNLLALEAKKKNHKSSKKVIIVADHTKFYGSALATTAPCNKIDFIVTDWKNTEIDFSTISFVRNRELRCAGNKLFTIIH